MKRLSRKPLGRRSAPGSGTPGVRTIGEYANSMFRFEQLHERWIESCTAYLVHLFGERIRDATVVDYAFGRGNWSLTFRHAGTARVIQHRS